MSYLPPIPPVVPPNAELGAEWVKRYMSDQSQFRDVLRKWIVSANLCCDTNTTAVAALDTRIDALEALGLSVPVPVAKGGTGAATASGARTNLGFGTFLLHTIYPWHHRGDAGMTLTDVAAGDAFLGKSNGNVAQMDLTHYTHARMTCRVTSAAAAGTRIVAKYRTVADGYSATISDYASIGTSTVALDLSSTGVISSSWIALAEGAKADVLLCPVQTGGDGATDPVIRLLTMEFKRE